MNTLPLAIELLIHDYVWTSTWTDVMDELRYTTWFFEEWDHRPGYGVFVWTMTICQLPDYSSWDTYLMWADAHPHLRNTDLKAWFIPFKGIEFRGDYICREITREYYFVE